MKLIDGGHEDQVRCIGGSWFGLGSGRSFCVLPVLTYSGFDQNMYLCRLTYGYLGDVRPEEWGSLQTHIFNMRHIIGDTKIMTSGDFHTCGFHFLLKICPIADINTLLISKDI